MTTRRLRVVLRLALAGWAGTLAAQSPSAVKGRVVDAATGEPVAQAEIRLGALLAVTGVGGSFEFGSVPPGRSVLAIRRIGYAPAEVLLEILPADVQRPLVRLVPRAVQLDTLLVESEPGGPVIAHDALVARGRTLAVALDGWEGLTVRPGPDGGAAPTLRGSAPDEVVVILDGFPINDPYTGRADLRRVPTRSVQGVRLHQGARSAAFGGRAIAGVLEVTTRTGEAGEVSLHAGSHGRLGGGALGGVGPITVTVSREGLPDGFGYPVPAVRGHGVATRTNAGGEIWSVNLRRSGTTEFILRGNTADRGLPGPVTNPTPTAHGRDWSVLAGLHRRGSLEVNAGVQFLGTHFEDATPPLGAPYDADSRGLDGSLRVARRLGAPGGRLQLLLGSGAGHTSYRGDNIPGGAGQWRGDLGLQADWRAAPSLTLSSIVRLDWWTGLGGPVGSGRGDLRLALGRTTLTAAAGSAVASPVLADLFFREGNGVRVNPHLQPERVRWEVELGARHATRIRSVGVDAGLRGYWGRVDDMVLWGQSPGYRFAWMPQNFDVVRRGGEATLGVRPLLPLSLSATASLSRLTRPWDGAPQLPYRPLYTVATTATWTAEAWRLDARWHLVSARNRDYRGVNTMPSYALLGLGAEVQPFGRVRLRAEVEDLLDRQPAYIAGYPTPGRSLTATLSYELP